MVLRSSSWQIVRNATICIQSFFPIIKKLSTSKYKCKPILIYENRDTFFSLLLTSKDYYSPESAVLVIVEYIVFDLQYRKNH